MTQDYAIHISSEGAVFSDRAPAIVQEEGAAATRELIEMGIVHLDEMLRPRPAGVYLSVEEAQKGHASTGNYRRNVHPEFASLNGRISDGNVVYGPWLEGTGSRNDVTRFKGYASFRKTFDWLEKLTPAVLRAHLDAAIARINGAGI